MTESAGDPRDTGLDAVGLHGLGDSTGEVVRRVQATGRPAVVTDNGVPVAVVLDPRAYRRLSRDRELLRRLALGELESAGGDGEPLEDVLADCDLLLEEN